MGASTAPVRRSSSAETCDLEPTRVPSGACPPVATLDHSPPLIHNPCVSSLDYRTRPARRVRSLEPAGFFTRELPDLLRHNGASAAPAARRTGLPPLTLEIDGRAWTLVPATRTVRVVEGRGDAALVVRLDAAALADLVDDYKSTLGLSIAGRTELLRGDGAAFVAWDPVLRAALDGRPAFEPGSISLDGPGGTSLDPEQRFPPDADPAELRAFLQTAGFLCIEGVFTAEEMRGVAEDLDRALESARPDDGASWWVRTRDGAHRPSRILDFLQQSPALRALLAEDRFLSLGAIAGEGHVHSDSFGEHFTEPSAEGLVKAGGVTEGISDLGWHKDCARGGHSRFCCGLTMGIAVTDADEESGELRVVAGSHRANLPGAGLADDVDLPIVALPTRAGDVTIHCSCTLHEARPPIARERKVVYTGFGLPPKFDDDDPPAGRARLARERANIGTVASRS